MNSKTPDLFIYRNALISKYGPGPTTRYVLITLSLHMDNDKCQCFPSTRTLSKETGLSERTICTHLEIAVTEGWIKKMQKGLSGQGWKRHQYEADIPPKALKEVQYQGTETFSAPSQKGTEPDAEGTEPDDIKALKEVQPNSSYNSSKNSSNIYTSDSVECRLSQMLLNLILKRNPKYKKPDLQKWAKYIDLAIRRDDRTPEELEAVIRWCQSDSFWQNNILSTEKLRKQFDQLWMQMKGNGDARNRSSKAKSFGNSRTAGERSTKYAKEPETVLGT